MTTKQGPLPKREAIVLVNGVESLNIDPIQLPVEMTTDGLVADVFDARLMCLMDVLLPLQSADMEYTLVWSDGWADVMGACPVCDEVFPVAEGGNADIHNEGVDAVWCGCDAKDSFNG